MAGHIQDITTPSVQSPELSKGGRTRERILDLTYDGAIRKGFAATSIEELVEAAGITKSGFFYHFRDKSDLAQQTLRRYFTAEAERADQAAQRARDLNDDPLHSFLVYLKLYAEIMQEVAAERPGCLVATIAFQAQAFDPPVHMINDTGVRAWRDRTLAWLKEIASVYPPQVEIDIETLADGSSALAIGGLALSKALKDPAIAAGQVMLYRELVRQVFLPR